MSLERNFYRLNENVGVLKVCADVDSPRFINCPITFAFIINLLITDDTTGSIYTYIDGSRGGVWRHAPLEKYWETYKAPHAPSPLDLCLEDTCIACTVRSSSSHTSLHSPEAPMDYTPRSVVFTFGECKRQSCVNISIVNDSIVEKDETFSVALALAPNLDNRIKLDSESAVVEIIDNDGMKCQTN